LNFESRIANCEMNSQNKQIANREMKQTECELRIENPKKGEDEQN